MSYTVCAASSTCRDADLTAAKDNTFVEAISRRLKRWEAAGKWAHFARLVSNLFEAEREREAARRLRLYFGPWRLVEAPW